jgi:uncharacterized alpha/beta hydrolase family protein
MKKIFITIMLFLFMIFSFIPITVYAEIDSANDCNSKDLSLYNTVTYDTGEAQFNF